MVNILFIVQELQIKNMYVCQPGFHVTFSAFAALTYITKGIKLMLTKKPTIGRVLRQVNWEQNGQRKQRVKSNTGSGWHLKLLTGTQAFCLLKYSTAILMCEWLVEKDELIYRKLKLSPSSVPSLSSKKNVACVASVSGRFRIKERRTRVKDRAKNGTSKRAFHFSRGQNRSFFAPKPNGNACYAG